MIPWTVVTLPHECFPALRPFGYDPLLFLCFALTPLRSIPVFELSMTLSSFYPLFLCSIDSIE